MNIPQDLNAAGARSACDRPTAIADIRETLGLAHTPAPAAA
jgi:hypothetical protein